MSKDVTLFHNPRCSKSRAALGLLEERGIQPTIVEYLKDPPDEATLRGVLEKLGMAARDLVRRGEDAFRELGLEGKLDDEDALIQAMVASPILIERPIAIVGDRARVGRPPESVLTLLEDDEDDRPTTPA